ncbi:hypothetical protein OUZ56_031937 [Daphnia magna]|uniref:Uncharacterized protein n=1 Tax=Daphnia magna TaxID=35525 RepID=A0ABQ9ZVR2_9CRUS|nr:hypothetical protein OUZ56_031937 [Daphnia magna]
MPIAWRWIDNRLLSCTGVKVKITWIACRDVAVENPIIYLEDNNFRVCTSTLSFRARTRSCRRQLDYIMSSQQEVFPVPAQRNRRQTQNLQPLPTKVISCLQKAAVLFMLFVPTTSSTYNNSGTVFLRFLAARTAGPASLRTTNFPWYSPSTARSSLQHLRAIFVDTREESHTHRRESVTLACRARSRRESHRRRRFCAN